MGPFLLQKGKTLLRGHRSNSIVAICPAQCELNKVCHCHSGKMQWHSVDQASSKKLYEAKGFLLVAALNSHFLSLGPSLGLSFPTYSNRIVPKAQHTTPCNTSHVKVKSIEKEITQELSKCPTLTISLWAEKCPGSILHRSVLRVPHRSTEQN